MTSQPDLSIEINKLTFDEKGLIPAILQHALSRKVLMLGYMNRQSLEKSIETGHCWFFSRSKQRLWEKGETSKHYQKIQSIRYDCDADALLIDVIPEGPTCHTGAESCFENDTPELLATQWPSLFVALDRLQRVIKKRKEEMPEGSYTTKLFAEGIGKIAKKFGEEGVEVALAAVSESDERLSEETADLLYNLVVLFEERGISMEEVGKALLKRAK